MNWIVSNWVERRAATEQNLRNAADVWKRAQGVLAETCDSLARYYAGIASITRSQQNSDLITITITRGKGYTPPNEHAYGTDVVSIKFYSEHPNIIVTINGLETQEFSIAADSDHAFIELQGNELVLDEFSRLVLEKAFFCKEEPVPSSPRLRLVR